MQRVSMAQESSGYLQCDLEDPKLDLESSGGKSITDIIVLDFKKINCTKSTAKHLEKMGCNVGDRLPMTF